MSWSIGYDNKWKRDIGYGVPAFCDHPGCNNEINRGLAYVCGAEQPYGGENGCGLYFCVKHQFYHLFRNGNGGMFCKRCISHKTPYKAKPEHPRWIKWKLSDKSWEQWRQENKEEVKTFNLTLCNPSSKKR
jgi:hypothetical protein